MEGDPCEAGAAGAAKGGEVNRYQWNRALIEPFTRMSLWGISYDSPRAAALRSEIEPRAWAAQAKVDALAGVELPASTEALLEVAASTHCHKVKLRKQLKGYTVRVLQPEVPPTAITVSVNGEQTGNVLVVKRRAKYAKHVVPPRALSWELLRETACLAGSEPLARLRELSESTQTGASRAEIASLLGLSINVESPDQVIEMLDRLGLPAKYKRGARRDDDPDSGRTSDEETLLALFMSTGHPFTKAVLEARGARGALSFLDSMLVDPDGRVRCSFANPGSETGRVLTRTWHSGSGGNLQAVSAAPINFRALLKADPGYTMAQCDLKGADGWTVAARCAQHGDSTMLLDLRAGIRIPSLLSLLMGGACFPANYDRADLRKLCKAVVKDWRDYAFKKAQHLSNYIGSAALIQRETVRESWSETGTPIDPGRDFCARVQSLYLARYWGLKGWWADCERQVRRTGTLEGASGQVREFLSRRWAGEGANKRLDRGTHKEVVASEPQKVTTYATNLALWRLWTDPENWPAGRVGDPLAHPIVIPLLHIHDALLVQFPSHLAAWAGAKLAQWFDNPVRIGTITVTIPVEMGMGSSWGECTQPFPLE